MIPPQIARSFEGGLYIFTQIHGGVKTASLRFYPQIFDACQAVGGKLPRRVGSKIQALDLYHWIVARARNRIFDDDTELVITDIQ